MAILHRCFKEKILICLVLIEVVKYFSRIRLDAVCPDSIGTRELPILTSSWKITESFTFWWNEGIKMYSRQACARWENLDMESKWKYTRLFVNICIFFCFLRCPRMFSILAHFFGRKMNHQYCNCSQRRGPCFVIFCSLDAIEPFSKHKMGGSIIRETGFRPK